MSLYTISIGLPSPAIEFEAFGDKLYAERLGFDTLRRNLPIFHFGVNLDTIYKGQCTGPTSACWIAGYALETGCHIGNECVWQINGTAGVSYHLLASVIKSFLKNELLPLPSCLPADPNCRDCSWWNYTNSGELSRNSPFSTHTLFL
jgi:lipase ATG15